jgi:hypothetical protein
MCGSIPPLSQYAFMAWYSKRRENFTFTGLHNYGLDCTSFQSWSFITEDV